MHLFLGIIAVILKLLPTVCENLHEVDGNTEY